jgi:hypothetical protein
MLDNVLDQSKLEQGKLVLDSKSVDLFALCTSVKDMLEHTKHEGMRLTSDILYAVLYAKTEMPS